MSLWTGNSHEPDAMIADSLAHSPSGSRIKMWLIGFCLALVQIVYGVRCLFTGHARLFGRNGSHLDLVGSSAISLAIAYVALGFFIHAHWFWGLHPRLCNLSPVLKTFALLVLIGSLGYTMFRIFV